MPQTAIKYLCEKDDVFKNIIEKWGIPTIPTRPKGFETLVLLILEQQVSIDSARATFLKLKHQIPTFLPQNIVETPAELFRACGVSRQKTSYIKNIAEAILDQSIDVDTLSEKSPEIVRQELIKIKGIGHWTIDVYLMFCLQSPDILPLGDIAVVNTIKELCEIHTKPEMEVYTQKWAPYRTHATFLLWHHYLLKRNRKA